MKLYRAGCFAIVFWVLWLAAGGAWGHQPRIVEGRKVEIENPEVSQAYYGELRGAPVEFRIDMAGEFRLYVGLLVPDLPGVSTDISAEVERVGGGAEETVAVLDGGEFAWKPFYERFAGDNYFWGPEYKAEGPQAGETPRGRLVPGGDYRIRVFSPTNEGEYVLAVGDIEQFPPREILRALTTVPQIKMRFFGEPLWQVLLAPFGWGTIVFFYLIAFVFGLILRAVLRRAARDSPRGVKKNMGRGDRWARAAIGLGLLAWAVSTNWHPVLLILSGLAFFEAIFSWCVIYAALGRRSCPAG